jgi:hypothetical protein
MKIVKTICNQSYLLLTISLSGFFLSSCSKKDIDTEQSMEVRPLPTAARTVGSMRWYFGDLAVTPGVGNFRIVNRYTGRLLNLYGNRRENNAAIGMWPESGTNNERWQISRKSNGNYTIKSVESGGFLNVTACGRTNGTTVKQYNVIENECSQWVFQSTGGGFYRIVNPNSNKSLSINASGFTVLNDYVSQYEEWEFRAIPNATQQDAYIRITAAMDAAVANYNTWGAFNKIIRVTYVPSVPTADANFNGNMRFGANTRYMVVETAQHELAHCYGVGTSPRWSTLAKNGKYTG